MSGGWVIWLSIYNSIQFTARFERVVWSMGYVMWSSIIRSRVRTRVHARVPALVRADIHLARAERLGCDASNKARRSEVKC